MRTIELWSDNISPPADPSKNLTNIVWAIAFNFDGTQLLAIVGDAILVYDSTSGEMVTKPIRGGHKENILCLACSRDGKRFATGGSDKTVVIWRNNFSPELKYTHSDAVQCLSFNPLTSQLFSGGMSDFSLWTPDVANVEKNKYNSRILCSSWTPDGQCLAFGTFNGVVSVRDKKLIEKFQITRKAPIWCLEWTPVTPENTESILALGTWDQTISFHDQSGKQIGADKNIGFDPLSINFFANGEFFVLSGTNKKASLWTREGGFITNICEKNDWIWSIKIKPKQMIVAGSTNNGNIAVYQLTSLIVHGLYQDRYAYRDVITDIVVQNMINDQKIRIKCKELVKKISIFKDRLAVQLNDKILVYLANSDENKEMKYKLYKKINKAVECSLLVVTSHNLILCQEKKLQMMNFSGEIEREWVLESLIRYIKVLGGPLKKESLLIGLKNGNVLKIFIDNSFPIVLIKQNVPIRCVDISLAKTKLAVVDDNNNLSVYDLITKDLLYNEMNVTSVAWNTDVDDILAYSGNGVLFIKTGNIPPTSQKMNGFVVGFKGSKLFVLHFLNMSTIDVPQTSSLLKYIEKKDFKMAYKLACLGITEQDFRLLGTEALQNADFEIAKKCFIRIKDLAFLELINKFEKDQKKIGPINETTLQAEVAAYQKKFTDAANIYLKAGYGEKAVELLTELKKWDEAKTFAKKAETTKANKKEEIPLKSNDFIDNMPLKQAGHTEELLKKQAQWTFETTGDWKAAANLYLSCKEYKKAIEIFGQRNDMESLVDICRMLDKSENHENIQLCAQYFRKNGNHGYAMEAYLKLGDIKSLMTLHIEFCNWEKAFMLASQNPIFKALIKLPYAEWLCKNDRFEEALKVYKSMGRPDLSTKILKQLSENATIESKFRDAAYFFWVLATDNLSLIKNFKNLSMEDKTFLLKFQENNEIAEIYHAYSIVHSFIDEPFQTTTGVGYLLNIFNAARFILCKLKNKNPIGIKKVYVYYAMAKVAKLLEGYKTARLCYEKLGTLRIPNEWSEEIELHNLLIRAKPFSDKESLQPHCNRCMNPNAILSNDDKCSTCYHPFVHSFLSFDVLPLVEFKLAPNLSHKKAMELINSEKGPQQLAEKRAKAKAYDNDGWTETHYGNEQTLTINKGNDDMESSPFIDKMNEICELQLTSQEYNPIVLDENLLKTLTAEEVYIVDYTQFCSSYEIKYYKNMVPEIPLMCCKECGRFYVLDEYEFEYLKTKQCPFCKALDPRAAGQNEDGFQF